MPCYYPLHAFKGKSQDAQKTKIVFQRPDSWKGDPIDLPCGQCIGCRLERARQWAMRCMHEASLYQENSFLTLTFDDDNLPKGSNICSRCVYPHVIGGSLCVSIFQDFMKRLRKLEPEKKIRFLHCGEYGDLYKRPHYHALLFNHGFSDRKMWSKRNGIRLYVSDTLSKLWPFGFSTVGDVTFESASYVARYSLKKKTGKYASSHYGSRKPEYITMSRRPGIGKGWFEKFKTDVYPRDRAVVRGFPSRPPRFYDNLHGAEDPASLALIKINREKDSIRYVDDVLSDGREIKVSDSCDSRLMVKEVVKKSQLLKLKKSLEEVI